jgi:hypothetical protein
MQNEIIDECCSSEWYVARAFHALFKDTFAYNGNGKWSVWDRQSAQWTPDAQNAVLRKHVKTIFCSYIRERAAWWQHELETNPDIDKHAASSMIMRLLSMSQKLQQPAFLRKVVRELQEFFE